MSAVQWERFGGVAGVLWFVAVLVSFFLPETPDADDPTRQIVAEIVDDRSGLLLSAWLLGAGAVLFLVFTAALWSRLRAAELERGPSVLVLLGGVGTSTVIAIEATLVYALVNAADEGRDPAAVRALFELDEVLFGAIIFTLIVFYLGVALCAPTAPTLPRALGWIAAVLATGFTLGSLFLVSADDNVFVYVAFFTLLVNFLWILAASIVLLRSPGQSAPAPAAPR